ncbi:MAG: GNAT family N-acetyltransferase [Theionarchaea archaeon]|nr:GNAT family N-acetyltransferase [Theionarchaea archaeon]
MMPVCLHDKKEIFSFLKKNVYLHIYSIGDLDDFFWDYTTWYGLREKGEIKALALVYTGTYTPVLLALTDELSYMKDLVSSISHLLPPMFYAHLSPGVEESLRGYKLKSNGLHYKMALRKRELLITVDTSCTTQLLKKDLDEIEAFYEKSYPDNFFDARMLETNMYYGIKTDLGLVSVAGIHVYSKIFKVAALGNITTHPDFRRKGYATAVTTRLLTSLLETVDHVGLNVKANNRAAIQCYENLGFEIVDRYEEFIVELDDKRNTEDGLTSAN